MRCGSGCSHCCPSVRRVGTTIQVAFHAMTVKRSPPAGGTPGRHRPRLDHRLHLSAGPRRTVRLLRGHVLAPAAGLDRRRRPAAAAPRGAHTGPSSVDRARNGPGHHVLNVPRCAEGAPTQLLPLVGAFPAVRGVRGRPRSCPGYLYADRGYDFDVYRRALGERKITLRSAHRGAADGSGLTPEQRGRAQAQLNIVLRALDPLGR